jgi:hypothetical protein
MNDELIDAVMAQMEVDLINGDYTALEELLKLLPDEAMAAYLPEEIANKITKGK